MSKLVTGWIEKTTETLGSPTALRVGFIFWMIFFIVSQLAIILFFVSSKIDINAEVMTSVKAVFSAGSILDFLKLAVTAFALIIIKIKTLVLLAGAGGIVAVLFGPILIPDSWIEPLDELLLIGETVFAIAVICLAALEILPFLV
ncbi:MAG: hypothetical protein WCI43_00145 [Candidatus Firestonebacteria bacterium]